MTGRRRVRRTLILARLRLEGAAIGALEALVEWLRTSRDSRRQELDL